MRESLLESKVVEHCKRLGILTYKFSSPAHRGVPDRVMIHADRVLFLELKAPGKKPSGLQHREIDRIRDKGGERVTASWADNYQDAVTIIDDHFIGCV